MIRNGVHTLMNFFENDISYIRAGIDGYKFPRMLFIYIILIKIGYNNELNTYQRMSEWYPIYEIDVYK